MLTSPPTGATGAPAVGDGCALSVASLRRRLREDTRSAHLAAEAAFDLTARLRSPEAYAEALLVMDALHRACEPALAVVAGALPASLRDGPARRRERLRADLRHLGHVAGVADRSDAAAANDADDAAGRDADGPAADAPAVLPVASPDAALGTWYVLEGAALGGLVIAAEARRRLPAVAGATTYFTGEGRRTAARWRTFAAVLDGWDADGHDAVVAGAHATFAHLDGLCERPG